MDVTGSAPLSVSSLLLQSSFKSGSELVSLVIQVLFHVLLVVMPKLYFPGLLLLMKELFPYWSLSPRPTFDGCLDLLAEEFFASIWKPGFFHDSSLSSSVSWRILCAFFKGLWQG